MPTIAELESQIDRTTNVRDKIDLLNALAWEYRHNDPQQSYSLSETASNMAVPGS